MTGSRSLSRRDIMRLSPFAADWPDEAQACRACRCTGTQACAVGFRGAMVGCWWVEADLCSACVLGPLKAAAAAAPASSALVRDGGDRAPRLARRARRASLSPP